MRATLVLTVLGPDRTGIVDALAERIAAVGGNWEESRMARLAGQFAGLLLVTLEADHADALVASLRGLEASGLTVTVRPSAAPAAPAGALVRLELTGNDRPGIVRAVSRVLAERGVNVEELESGVGSAPMTGEPLFRARARLRVPPSLALPELRKSLEAIAGELMVDLSSEE
jgi:glycine cleavage system regulatory protein